MEIRFQDDYNYEIRNLPDMSDRGLIQKKRYGYVTTFILQYITKKLTDKGFQWLLPVILSKSTDPLWPDPGASIEKRIQTEIYGEPVSLTSSMIIHKMISSSLLYTKFFILSPNVRIERRERKATKWHSYEFTQLDFEIRNATFDDVRSLTEELIHNSISQLRKVSEEKVGFRWLELP